MAFHDFCHLSENRIIWSDWEDDINYPIQAADTPNGNNRVIVRLLPEFDVSDMALYYNNLYMTGTNFVGSLLRMPKDGSSQVQYVGSVEIANLMDDPNGITVVFSKYIDSDGNHLGMTFLYRN